MALKTNQAVTLATLLVIFALVSCVHRESKIDHGHPDRNATSLKTNTTTNENLTLYELLLPTVADRQMFTEFFGDITNVESMVEWRLEQVKKAINPADFQRWAVTTIQSAKSETNTSKHWIGVGIRQSALPENLKELGGPVAAAVVHDGHNEAHVRIAWRSIDSFWGLAAGDPHFKLTDDNLIIKEWQPGLYIWHSK